MYCRNKILSWNVDRCLVKLYLTIKIERQPSAISHVRRPFSYGLLAQIFSQTLFDRTRNQIGADKERRPLAMYVSTIDNESLLNTISGYLPPKLVSSPCPHLKAVLSNSGSKTRMVSQFWKLAKKDPGAVALPWSKMAGWLLGVMGMSKELFSKNQSVGTCSIVDDMLFCVKISHLMVVTFSSPGSADITVPFGVSSVLMIFSWPTRSHNSPYFSIKNALWSVLNQRSMPAG